jgi:monomeric isocitrate dehydrogenase
MLQVGAKTMEAAFSFASGASSLNPIVRRSSGSKVAPMAVDDYRKVNPSSTLWVTEGVFVDM